MITIIKKTDLTNLVYLDGVEADTSGSLLLATASIIDDNGNTETTEGVLDAEYFQNVLNVMVRYNDITSEQMQQAMQTINQSEDVREVEVKSYGASELLVTTKKDWVIGSLKGTMAIVATGVLSSPEAPTQTQTISGDNITEIVDWNNGLPQAVQLTGLTSLIKVPNYIPSYWTTLEGLFESCSLINDVNITKWNTGSITSMKNLFFGCSAFNQPIGSWNVSAVKNIDNMLSGCAAFNQNLSGWAFSAGTSHNNYDNSTTAWQSDYKPTFAA